MNCSNDDVLEHFLTKEEFDEKFTYTEDAITTLWLMTGAINILTMQIGFSLFEVGSVSSRNTYNILIKNMFD